MVVLLVAGSALFFGALAVTIRLALNRGIDPEAAALVTTVIACLICLFLVRWAARGSEVPGFVAATASLVSATVVILVVVASRPQARERIARAAGPFVPSGLVYGISYACLYTAFDRGRVTVVAPLVATESLFAVLISITLLRTTERIGPRLFLAAALVVGGGALISTFR